MNLDQYTNKAICRSMGLDGFVDSGWSESSKIIRLLLKPSFSPEVCLTLEYASEDAKLSVIALSEMFWHQPCPCRLAEYREEVIVDLAFFAQCQNEVQSAHERSLVNSRVVSIDGMSLACSWNSTGKIRQFNDYASNGQQEFVSSLINHAWSLCKLPSVKNALANCGRYVGLNLPIQSEPEPSNRSLKIMVLGVDKEKADFFQALSKASSRLDESST